MDKKKAAVIDLTSHVNDTPTTPTHPTTNAQHLTIPLRRASRRRNTKQTFAPYQRSHSQSFDRKKKKAVVIDLTNDKSDTPPTPKHQTKNTQHTTGYWRTTLLYDDGFGGLAFGESFFVND